MKCSYSISPPCSPLATAATVFFWLGVGQLDTIGNETSEWSILISSAHALSTQMMGTYGTSLSCSCLRANLATCWKACSTLMASLALKGRLVLETCKLTTFVRCDSPSLEVRNVTLLLAPSHSSLLADNTLVVQIDFVAYNHEGEVVRIAGSSLIRILAQCDNFFRAYNTKNYDRGYLALIRNLLGSKIRLSKIPDFRRSWQH
jgi:hypothetical protein